MTTAPDARLAVLIDADNAQPSRADALMAEVATLGLATVKRIYGDWTTSQLTGWKSAANRLAIQPMQQFAYTKGKNSTDSALIIDAMDLLYSDRVDGFVLVSSDSDFTRLASRLRESGKTVYGVGERKTPDAFRAACDRFIYTDVLGVEEDEDEVVEPEVSAVTSRRRGEQATPAHGDVPQGEVQQETAQVASRVPTKQLRQDAHLMQLLRNAVAACSDDDGWAQLGSVGTTIAKRAPEFDSRNWGYAKLIGLVTATDDFEVDRPEGSRSNGGGGVRIRRRRGR